MQGEGLVAGVDCSTQSTKVLIVEVATGRIVAEGREDHDVVYGAGGAAETDPEVWWRALAGALARTGMADRVDAISVAAQQHGLVVVDGDGAPLRPAMLWCDLRSSAEAAEIVAQLGGPQRAATLAGSVPIASFTAPKWAWVRRHEPEIARRAAGLRLPHDWLNERLTGVPTTDRGDASGTAWWSPATGGYEPDLLALPALALEERLLPQVLGPTELAGTVTDGAAAALGLRPGIPVGPGTGDNAGAALALGLTEGQPVVSLGTSATAYTRSARPYADPTGTVAGFADATGAYLPLVCVQNCTLAVETMAGILGVDREAVPDRTDVVVLPYFAGERTPYLPHASASIVGLRSDSTAGDILLGTYRGVAATILGGLGMLELRDDAPLILIGGGTRGTVWERVIGELSGRELLIPDQKELVALGAAVQAAAVVTGDDRGALAQRWGAGAGRSVPAVAPDATASARIGRVDAMMRELNGAPL